MSTKEFTELTREELIVQAADIFESNLSKHKRLMGLLDADKDDTEEMLAIKIRNDYCYEAKFNWTYYNNEEGFCNLEWVEITEKKLRQRICDSLAKKTLNQLRLSFQVSIKDQYFVKENISIKAKFFNAMDVVKRFDIEMTRRIDKVSEIPEETKFIGKVKDKLDAALIEEHGIDPNIAIWSDNENILLTAHTNEDESRIATVALKRHGEFYIFTEDEAKKGLKILLMKLDTMSFGEIE